MDRCRWWVGAMLVLPAALVAQQAPTFRTGVDVVNVDVSVSRSGEHIEGLKVGNFEVYDNGVKQKIDKVTLEQVPLESYLVFDVSGSIEGPKLQQLEQATQALQKSCRNMRIDFARMNSGDLLDVSLSSFLATRAATMR